MIAERLRSMNISEIEPAAVWAEFGIVDPGARPNPTLQLHPIRAKEDIWLMDCFRRL